MERNFSQITFDFTHPENPVQTSNPQPPKPENITVKDDAEAVVAEEPVVTFTPVQKAAGRGRKSQKLYAAEADLVNIPDDEILFQKQYYTIGEVSQMFQVNASLLRFWESEFDIIKPRKNRKGDRHFRPVDIKNLQLIYDLLRRRKLTIDGARDFIRNNKKSQERFAMIQSLQKIKSFLLEIKASL
jgi:DNA-binding transcriptional MerR regulator